jgi:hypothetical protein
MSRAKPNTLFQFLKDAIGSHNSDECLIWPFGKVGSGYGEIQFKGKRVMAHRLAFYITHQHWPFPQARHTCDNPACFNPRHILEGTPAQNMKDKVDRSRANNPIGTRNGMSKLTNSIVKRIRQESIHESQSSLAKRYGLDQSNISHIVQGKTWKHVA